MEDTPRDGTFGDRSQDEPADTRRLRRVLIAAGLVIVVLILLVVAIYTVAFLILAPMMY